MKRILSSMLLAAASSSAALAQGTNAAGSLSEARENLRTYAEEAKNRQAELSRKIQVLRTLGDAGDAISTFSTSLSLDKARGKLAEAKRLAETDPALSEPVPSVLAAVGDLVNGPGMGSPDQIKAKVFVAVSRLEEHVVQQVTMLESEALDLENMVRSIHVLESGMRSVVGSGLATAIHVRRLAGK